MTPNEYQKLALVTEKTPTFLTDDKGNHGARLLHGAIGICTEAGELQDAIKKNLIYGKPLDGTNIMEECGDILWYVALCLDASGYTMEQAMERNIAKLKARFGDKFTEHAALNRDLDAERAVLEDPRCAGPIIDDQGNIVEVE